MPFIEHKFFIHSWNINFFEKENFELFLENIKKIIYLLSRKSEEGKRRINNCKM